MENVLETGLTRRGFAGYLLRGVAAITVMGSVLGTVACPLSRNLYNQILAYCGIGLQAFSSVLNILAGAGVIPLGGSGSINGIIALIKAGFADLQTAVNDYDAAPAADKATRLGQISTVLADLQVRIQQFWSDLQIPDERLSSLVQGLLGVILTALAGFAAQLPPPAAPVALRVQALRKKIGVTPRKLTQKEFESEFNKVLTDGGQQPVRFKN